MKTDPFGPHPRDRHIYINGTLEFDHRPTNVYAPLFIFIPMPNGVSPASTLQLLTVAREQIRRHNYKTYPNRGIPEEGKGVVLVVSMLQGLSDSVWRTTVHRESDRILSEMIDEEQSSEDEDSESDEDGGKSENQNSLVSEKSGNNSNNSNSLDSPDNAASSDISDGADSFNGFAGSFSLPSSDSEKSEDSQATATDQDIDWDVVAAAHQLLDLASGALRGL